jgi:tellurite resistance protein
MTSFSIKHFDALAYVKQAKLLGTDENLAEFQARQIEQAIEVAISSIENKDLATKQDIELAIAQLKHDTLRFVVWTGVAVVIALGGMLAKGFHWF